MKYRSRRSRAQMYEACKRLGLEHLTIRSAAQIAQVSKSLLHRYVHTELERTDKDVYDKCMSQIEVNFVEKHIRGGEATRKSWRTRKCKGGATNRETYSSVQV